MEEKDLNQQFDKIVDVNIAKELKDSFLNYAMSVIVSRALPDVRDGLKPVQRRIIYGMEGLSMGPGGGYKKSARLVGEVMGKYHPHGDSSIYDATVRMAQDFSYRYPLVNGHGNFGSIDGDGAAAMRYTEVKMNKITVELLRDLNKKTVDFVDNYDGLESEPVVLPSRFPNLLVNGSTGIAVGMATNIPPHNLSEVIDGAVELLKNPEITVNELMNFIKAPDFPTGGEILGISGLRDAYNTGRGSILIRSKCEINELPNGKSEIVVKEIPYQVNKSKLIDKIAELAKEKKIDGITDLKDESNRNGIRIVITLRKDVSAEVILNNLFKYSQLQTSFGFNMIALVDGRPTQINLKDALHHYLVHQNVVIVRRARFDLEKAENREHIVSGLLIALASIDEVVEIIKSAENDADAEEKLMMRFALDKIQATSILDMRLRRLTSLEISKLEEEKSELLKTINNLKEILDSKQRQDEILEAELLKIKDSFGDERVSDINYNSDLNIEDEDLIPVEDIIITLTNKGYCKRSSLDTYKTQRRGGRGITAQKTYEDDFVEQIIHSSSHDTVMFFTNTGRVFKLKGYQIPTGGRVAKGLPLQNLLNFKDDEVVKSVLNIKEFCEDNYLLFFTKQGLVKRTELCDYANIRANGIIAINLKDDDELLSVRVTNGECDIMMAATNGKALRFSEAAIRSTGRVTSGVKGMEVAEKNVVGSTVCDDSSPDVLVVTENGYGKRTAISEFRLQRRGGLGSKSIVINEKNGPLISLRSVSDNEDVIIITNDGIIIRIDAAKISRFKRVTKGVRLIRLNEGQKVAYVTVVPKQQNDELDEEILEGNLVSEEA